MSATKEIQITEVLHTKIRPPLMFLWIEFCAAYANGMAICIGSVGDGLLLMMAFGRNIPLRPGIYADGV
jgi:hypothetical protein